MIRDALDLATVHIYNAPGDIASWPQTVDVTQLTMHPGAGLTFQFEPRQNWPDYTPPTWTGPIQYTVWAIVQVNGTWHGSGFIQMWRDRPSTGAPILTEWKNWAYDRNRWGNMVDYVPNVGDRIGFLLSAGNARNVREVTSVRERSNVVLVHLPTGDSGVFTFQGEPPQEPIPEPPPPVPVIPNAEVERILTAQHLEAERILAAIQEARTSVNVYGPMIEQLLKFWMGKDTP